MLTYTLDITPESRWPRTTPTAAALAQPYVATEAGLFFGGKSFSTARSDKQSYLLFLTLQGAGLIEQGDNSVLLKQGQALLMNCRTPQRYCTAPGESCWHHYWVHLDGPGVAAMEPLLIPGKRLTPVNVSVPELTEEFDRILANLEKGDMENILLTCQALHSMLTTLALRQYRQETVSSVRSSIMDTVLEIEACYEKPLRVEALAAHAHMSRSYYLRVFRQVMGTTPYNYLLSCRITHAKELLATTDLSVCDIAFRVGFGNESNFSTRFSSMTGQSPALYRKTALKASTSI